jgi:hypothetical protein
VTRSSYSPRYRLAAAGFVVCLAATVATMAISAGSSVPSPSTSPASAPDSTAASRPLPASPPTRLRIEKLGVSTAVVRLGTGSGQSLELPPLHGAGWDATSVTPGQAGITVVAGFIRRGTDQPGALRDLGKLKRGDIISLRRADDQDVDYRVARIAYYPEGTFPAAKVFAPVSSPELRLVTTGGALRKGDPLGNAVVYATAD